jgi:hypothetical protein
MQAIISFVGPLDAYYQQQAERAKAYAKQGPISGVWSRLTGTTPGTTNLPAALPAVAAMSGPTATPGSLAARISSALREGE